MRLLYTGPSLLDPTVPIFVAATGPSANRKTGPMTQVWILRSDISPVEAVMTHADAPICGLCRHRGIDGRPRTCYVTVHWAPGAVYRAFKAKHYTDSRRSSSAFHGQRIRVGAYGDPAALDYGFWSSRLTWRALGWTGYTHQWRTCDARLKYYLMASVDSVAEMRQAAALGWRTFRVRTPDSPIAKHEITCPASDEAGKRTTCARCLLCDGLKPSAKGAPDRRKSIVILAHGADQAFGESQQIDLPY